VRRFEEIDHSGDVGVEARGATLAEVVENATAGLFSLMTRAPVAPRVVRTVEVRATDAEALLVEWLSEVIALAATHGEVYGEVKVARATPTAAAGEVRGERVDADRHQLRFDVKAATYHALLVERVRGGYRARVIFDL